MPLYQVSNHPCPFLVQLSVLEIGKGHERSLLHRALVSWRNLRPDGRVIVIERLPGEIGEPKLAPLADLNMMVLLTGLERTLEQYCLLFRDAGLRFWKCAPIGADMAVIEAVALFS